MSLTGPELEEILDDFIQKQNTAFENSNSGRTFSNIETYLRDMKQAISDISKNTGPEGSMSSRNLAEAMSKIDHDRSNRNGGSGGGNGAPTILENENKGTTDDLKKLYNEYSNAASKTKRSWEEMVGEFKGVIKNVTGSFDNLIKRLDENDRLYGQLNTSGMAWSNSATEMALEINRAGFSVQSFSKILSEGTLNLRSLGDDSILNFASAIQKSNERLGDFGLGVDMYYKESMQQAEYFRVSGRLQEITNKDVGDSFHDLLGRTVALSGAFGMSVDEFLKAKQNLQTDEVNRSLIRNISRRTGISSEEINNNVAYSRSVLTPEMTNSALNLLNGRTDAEYARNQEVISQLAKFLTSSGPQRFTELRRLQQEGTRQADIDERRIAAGGQIDISQSEWGRSRTDTNNALLRLRDSTPTAEQFQKRLDNILHPDNVTRENEGLRYAREQGMGAIQSIDNSQIETFNKTVTASIDVIKNMYSVQYPELADKINKTIDSFRNLDDKIATTINNNQEGLARSVGILGMGQNFVQSLGPSAAIGLAGGAIGMGYTARKFMMARSKSNLAKNKLMNAAANHESAFLDDMEPVPSPEQMNSRPSSSSTALRGMSKITKYGGGALAAFGAGYQLYDAYETNSDIDDQLRRGKINSDNAKREKWENWGSHIGSVGGGILGGVLGATAGGGIGSAATGILGSFAGEQAGKYIGEGLGWTGYELSGMFGKADDSNTNNNNVDKSENHQEKTKINNDIQNHNIDQVIKDNTGDDIINQLIRVNDSLTQMCRINNQVLSKLTNISPYTH